MHVSISVFMRLEASCSPSDLGRGTEGGVRAVVECVAVSRVEGTHMQRMQCMRSAVPLSSHLLLARLSTSSKKSTVGA